MRSIGTRARDALQLLRGAAAPHLAVDVATLQEASAFTEFALVSFDVFDTLLALPNGGARQVERLVAEAAQRGTSRTLEEVIALRRSVAAKLRAEARRRGDDPEATQADIATLTLRALGRDDVAELCAIELAALRKHTMVTDEARALLENARRAGARVIAVSDTYLTTEDLTALLGSHGLTLDRVYTSADEKRIKSTGRLFERVLLREGTAAARVLHIGDDLIADVVAPRRLGIRSTRHIPSTAPFRLGYEVLGPAIAVFAHRVLLDAGARGIDYLGFVARDGELLMRALQLISPETEVRYLHLSRRSALLAEYRALDRLVVSEALSLKRGNRGLSTVFASLELDAAPFGPALDRLGYELAEPIDDARLAAVLADREVQEVFAEQATARREILRTYLTQEGLFAARRPALIDVGWRGTIQSALSRAFPELVPLEGFYLGLWDDGIVSSPRDLERKHGLLSDSRRRRSVVEAAGYYLAFLFEAVCRADHGTVIGYREHDGVVAAQFAEDTPARHAERRSTVAAQPIRAGILAYVADYASALPSAGELETRSRDAKRRLARLAFFPSAPELAAAEPLQHTDTFDDARHASIVRGASKGLAGLEGTWRGGYIASSVGVLGSLAYVLAESALLFMPHRARRTLRSSLTRLAR